MPDPAVRDAIRAQYQDEVRTLSDQLSSGDIDLDQWHDGMKQTLRDSYALNLRAGSDTPVKYTEYLKLGTPLQKQYRFLEQFKADIASGATTGKALMERALLYALAGVEMYWRQITKGTNLPDYPPEHPRCECEWVDNGDGTWTWQLGDTDTHCPVCIEYSQKWNPYTPP